MIDLSRYLNHTLSNGAPRYYISMHQLYKDPKTGREDLLLAPSREQIYYSTPAGLFAYPLTDRTLSNFMTLNLEYREESSHVVLIEATDPTRMLWIKEKRSKEARLLGRIQDQAIDTVAEAYRDRGFVTSVQKFRQLLLAAGFTSVFDTARTLHITHKEQIVFLTQKACRIVGSFDARKVRQAHRPKSATVDLSAIESKFIKEAKTLSDDPNVDWDNPQVREKIHDINDLNNIFVAARGAGEVHIKGPASNLERELKKLGEDTEGEIGNDTFYLKAPNKNENIKVTLTTSRIPFVTPIVFERIQLLRLEGPIFSNISVYESNVIWDVSGANTLKSTMLFEDCTVRVINPTDAVLELLRNSKNTVIVDKLPLRGPPIKENPNFPTKYFDGLSPEEAAQRQQELEISTQQARAGVYRELPSDAIARKKGLVKLSAYRKVAQDRGFDVSQVDDVTHLAEKALRYYKVRNIDTKMIDALARDLSHVYRKGLAAWGTGGHRPGASQTGWADSRVASVLVGGKAAWTADNKQFRNLPTEMQQAIIQQLPSLYTALAAQGRHADIRYIRDSV